MTFQHVIRSGLFLVLAAALLLLAPRHACAQGKVDAKYEATLSGIPIGQGSWTIAVDDNSYSAVTTAATTGLLKVIGGGSASVSVQGRMASGQFQPAAYVSSVMYGRKKETIRINLNNGNVKDFAIEPDPPVTPDRIPVTEAHRRGVFDPMTGALFRVPGNGDVLGPDGCAGKASIFDGRMRFDLELSYKGRELMKLAGGRQIPVVVCSLYFKPIAGYVPSRAAIKYLTAQRDMDVALAPIAGTRVLVPVRFKIPTPVGMGMIEATEFNTIAAAVASSRASKTN
jgi:hypothetical protein